MQTLELPLKTLSDLMFQFDEYSLTTATSITNREPECYRPRLVPRRLGELFASRNALETPPVFHIIHYDTHSEIWHYKQWMASASHRWELRKRSEESSIEFIKKKEENMRIAQLREQVEICVSNFLPGLRQAISRTDFLNLVFVLCNSPREVTDKYPGLTQIVHNESTLT